MDESSSRVHAAFFFDIADGTYSQIDEKGLTLRMRKRLAMQLGSSILATQV